MASIKDIGITVAEAAEAVRILGTAGAGAAQAASDFQSAMIRLSSAVVKYEVKKDFIARKVKKTIKPPKYRLIRDD
jgi:hypothetical protein